MAQWIIAVDAGGSKCSACLYTMEGEILGKIQTGPSNLFTDFQAGMFEINSAAMQLLASPTAEALGVDAASCIVSIGAAGASIASVQEAFSHWQHPFQNALLESDLAIACYAANQGKACAFVVLGTGSSIAVYQDGMLNQYGGHGFLLGDQASGAWLGQKAMRWYMRALESCDDVHITEKSLMQALSAKVGNNVDVIITKWGSAKASEFATLAPILIALKQQSTKVSEWLQQGEEYIVDILQQRAPHLPIFIGGGLAFVYKEAIQARLQKPIVTPQQNAEYGAYLMAKDNNKATQ